MRNSKWCSIAILLCVLSLSACGRKPTPAPTQTAAPALSHPAQTLTPLPQTTAPIKGATSATSTINETAVLTFKFEQDSDLSAFPTSGLVNMTKHLREEALVIAMTAPGGAVIPIVAAPGNTQVSDRVTATITMSGGTASGGVALHHVSGRGYVCNISKTSGAFTCRLLANDQWQNLLSGRLPTQIDPQRPLILDLSESDGVFSLSINGEFAGSFRDEQYRDGAAAIFAETAESNLSEVTFDDVSVHIPKSTTTTLASVTSTAQSTRTPRPPQATPLPTTNTPPPTRAEASAGIAATTLPLAEGNKWVYKKTVSRKVFAWEAYGKLGEDSVTFARGTPPDIPLGESEETFTVVGKVDEDGLEFWEIAVSSPTARDGRYGSWLTTPDRILWGGTYSDEQVVEIQEIMISESVFEGEKRHHGLLLLEPLVEGKQAEVQFMNAISFTASFESANIQVPAGNFETCLEMITQVKGSDDQEGWTTISYYAPGVGLVAEVQLDDQDQPTYTLELLRYELNSPSKPIAASTPSLTPTVRPTSTPTPKPTRNRNLTGKLEVEGEVKLAYDTNPLGGGGGSQMYRVQVHLTNGTTKTVTYDVIDGAFLVSATQGLHAKSSSVDGKAMKLESGEDVYFEFDTDGYTSQLLDEAGGNPLFFAITLLYKEKTVAGMYATQLPKLEALSQTSGVPLEFVLLER
jgi:hypothetical protein